MHLRLLLPHALQPKLPRDFRRPSASLPWAFQQEWIVGSPSGVSITRPSFIRTEWATYWFALGKIWENFDRQQ